MSITLKECDHNWVRLNGMETYRENDRSFNCIAGNNWCTQCGSLEKSYMDGPYSDVIKTIIKPNGAYND